MNRFICILLLLACAACRPKRSVETTASSSPKPPSATTTGLSQQFAPYSAFQFERSQLRNNKQGKAMLHDAAGSPAYIAPPMPFADSLSPVGSCWITGGSQQRPLILFDEMTQQPPAYATKFTIEMALRFSPDSMDTFQAGFADAQISISPGSIIFAVGDSAARPDKNNRITVDNDGRVGLTPYLYDGGWHHFAFIFEGDPKTNTGMLRLLIDGKTANGFRKKTKTAYSFAGKRFRFGFLTDKKRSRADAIDELAIWWDALPENAVTLHSSDFFDGQHYRSTIGGKELKDAVPDTFDLAPRRYDPKEFAPGFPRYTVSQQEQLETFPLPRFRDGELPRNFPWIDLTYTTYNLDQAKRDTAGAYRYPGWNTKEHSAAALALDSELYSNWNYYFLIPSPMFHSGDFTVRSTINGRITKYADQHPETEVCTILFWGQLQPKRAGYTSQTAYILSNTSINPCDGDTLYPGIEYDGLTQRKNLDMLVKLLPHRDSLRKIDFINENGEVFGASRTPNAEGFRGSSFISCIQKDSAHARADRARWQYQVFSTYSRQFVNTPEYPPLLHTRFSFYQVAGFMPRYYSEWTEMRKINTQFHGMYYSTPDFYPGEKKWNIWETHGPYHGLDVIRDGRKYEIARGDSYFSPFVCAGWSGDSVNFRPAEWLAAMKALAMMGAEFYYPAYFNVANPAKLLPQDPRGYIYQLAMPVYAQAVTSRFAPVFYHSKNFTYIRNYNKLLIWRKDTLEPVYAIHASVFPGTNYAGAAGEITSNVDVDGDPLKLVFRPQGATYLYDKSDPAHVVFYQLDGWHEDKHPYYWSRDFDMEAELHDDTMNVNLRTEQPAGAEKGDYTRYTTYVYFRSKEEAARPLQFHFEPRPNDTAVYYIWIRARSSSPDGSGIRVKADEGESYEVRDIAQEEFRWYCVSANGRPVKLSVQPGQEHTLFVSGLDKAAQVDRIVLSRSAKTPGDNPYQRQ